MPAFSQLFEDPMAAIGYGLLTSGQNPVGAAMGVMQQAESNKAAREQQEFQKLMMQYKMQTAGRPLSKIGKIQADIEAGRIPKEYANQALEAAVMPQINPYQIANLDLAGQRLSLQAEQNAISNQMRQDQMLMQQQARQDMAKERAQTRAEQKAERGAEKYSTMLENSGLAEVSQMLKNVNDILPQEGDIPGFGYGSGIQPDLLTSKEGVDMRQAVAGLRNSILKARSGGAVTPQEAERFLQELGEGTFKSDDQLRTGVKNVTQALQNRIANVAAGVPKESLDIYAERGGKILPSSVAPQGGGSAGKPPQGVSQIEWDNMTPEERALWK